MPANRAEDIADDRQALERLCVATRLVRPVGELIRFVASPDGVLTPDLKRKLPGRGAWVTASRAAFVEAVRKKAFARALKRPVDVPADLASTIGTLLERRALDMLALANKAGLAGAGYAKVMERIEAGRAVAVIQAVEGAADGARKLASAAHRAYLSGGAPVFITNFSSSQLSLALGRTNVIHAALGAGPASIGFLDRVAALAFWRDGGFALAGPAPVSGPPSHADDEPFTDDNRPATDGNHAGLDRDRGDPQDLARND
jgi:predicted RNA-binding protein YlxR (DUF448 family)